MALTRTLVVSNLDAPIVTGRVTLVGGTATDVGVLADNTANARVSVTRFTPGGTLGNLSYAVAGDDLTINSDQALETSDVDYIVIG